MRRLAWSLTTLAVLAVLTCTACTSSPDVPPPGGGKPLDPASPTEQQQAALDAIAKERAASASLTADALATAHALPHVTSLGYDPLAAGGLDLVAASSFALNDAEKATLKARGFVISERQRFPTFTLAYGTIYSQDLPVFVSADSILEAVHRSYDKILMTLEREVLSKRVQTLLTGMRANLAAATSLRAGVRADLDVYLGVALGLLSKDPVAPVAGGSKETIDGLLTKAKAASGTETVKLFGTDRLEDFSQFTPRGHYAGDPLLEAYFRASMWLGRIDLRLLETQSDYSQRLNRPQVEATLAMGAIMGEAERAAWTSIDGTIGAFVGETDAMTPAQIAAFQQDLGVATPAGIDALDDAKIRAVIAAGGYGAQRIASHVMINGLDQATMPLSASFLLLGQRYVVDSHVFANVVFDRVAKASVKRMMPSTLDVAFAAFGNDQAASMLLPELKAWPYAPDLHMMRFLVDAHPKEYWGANLYNLWLGAVRALSPKKAEIEKPKDAGLPTVTSTEAWGRRVLQTQLASWAELRHDTLLYAKQSYTGGTSCEFPDAYVDPYPEVFAKLEAFAARGRALVTGLDFGDATWVQKSVDDWFVNLATVSKTLRTVADQERKGVPLTTEQLAFFDTIVKLHEGCGSPVADGWYAKLHYGGSDVALEFDPTIADVHTQPTDEGGAMVGRVLHVATGSPRTMVVTFDGCAAPRAYVGVVSSYFERITRGFERLTDQKWASEIKPGNPEDVPWMTDLVAR